MLTKADIDALETLWAFLGQGSSPPVKKSVGVLCGSRDLFVSETAAELFHLGLLDPIVCTGGLAHADDLLATGWSRPEALMFADALVADGVPAERILIEDKAANTAENVAFSLALLLEEGFDATHICFIHKPFMTLRTCLTARKVLNREDFSVCSPAIGLPAYLERVDDPEKVASILVGDFERIFVYGLNGFAEPCPISAEAIAAAGHLRQAGYAGHSIIR